MVKAKPTAPRMRHRKLTTGEPGFTLLELLVVLTVAGMMLAIGVPRLTDTVARARLSATADKVAAQLRLLRSLAMHDGAPRKLTIDPSRHAYSSSGKRYSIPEDEVISFVPFDRSAPPGTPIEFLPEGGSNGGTLVISAGQRQLGIEIDWLTGRVTVRD